MTSLFSSRSKDVCDEYRILRDAKDDRERIAREHCEDLWRDFARVATDEFIPEFTRRIHDRWFEMYLAVALIRSGHDVSCLNPGPDICLNLDGRRIWIEATCASSGDPERPDSVPPRRPVSINGRAEFIEVPKDQCALRIQNSLSTKCNIFRDYVNKGVIPQDDQCVIALNVANVHPIWLDMNRHMQRAMYGLGDVIYAINPDTAEIIETRRQQLIHIIKKSTGASVGVTPFIDGSMRNISAVIGSRCDLANIGDRIGADFII